MAIQKSANHWRLSCLMVMPDLRSVRATYNLYLSEVSYLQGEESIGSKSFILPNNSLSSDRLTGLVADADAQAIRLPQFIGGQIT